MWFERLRNRSTTPLAQARPHSVTYRGKVAARDVEREPVPEASDLRVFDVAAALDINEARMRAIESLDLPLEKRRVLDVGSGPGHFTRFYTSRGCEVVAIDGRADNVDEFRRRNPGVRAVLADVQSFDLTTLGRFDIVHCLGLIYHLESPIAALRQMFRVCDGVLLLETLVMDSPRPYLELADEPKTVNQALSGIGCRPSPAFVTMALNRVGFTHVYTLAEPPDHDDFRFEWRDDGAWQRGGHPLRCMFVAALRQLPNPGLIPLTA